ncbi:MAG: DUF1638 domain-containing protein, partial [Fimbriimonadaceae bacterium]|nr:DUF1638 domain-containing protein [Alphaproteobacteria bacterium]
GWLVERNQWCHMELTCLPADLHNRPQHIPAAMRKKIRAAKETKKYSEIFAIYGDCGTGGLLDAVLQEEGAARLPGAHCYEFFAGPESFGNMVEEELGTFYLTDYLVRHFDRIIFKGLGLDRFPHLRDDYFAHYKRVIYLAQTENIELQDKAREAAARLGLAYEYRATGYGDLQSFLKTVGDGARSKDKSHVLTHS